MSLFWLRIAVVLYGVASLAVLPDVLYDRPRWRNVALPLTVAALLFHFVSVAEMLMATHHFIPVSASEVQAVLGLLLAASFLLVFAVYRTMTIGVVLLPLVFLLGLLPAFAPGQHTLEAPLLRSGWITLHIVLLLAAYAALIVSLLSSLLYLVQEQRLKARTTSGLFSQLPPLQTTDQIALRSLLIGLPCMTGGLLIGSALAANEYGAVYFRDPKVLLSFAMWLAYVAMIAIRRNAGLRGRRAVWLSSFVFLVMLAVWSANQVSTVHRYAGAMSLLLLGVNHLSAPLDVRERLAIPAGRLADATRSLAHRPGVREALILSTCNRVELLTEQESVADLRSFLEEYFSIRPRTLEPHLYEFREREAVRHLFRVASSLDSMVVGEPQILGQVKDSYAVAREVGAVSTNLDRLLQSAFAVAKKVRTETEIGSSSVSIASVAVDLAKRIFGSLQRSQVLLVGAGKMSELAARHLIAQGADQILVANRTAERAQRLAAEFHGLAVPFADLQAHAPKADIIVTSTGAGQHLFNVADAQAILHKRRGKPVFFIDIAVPRDVDPAVNRIDGAFVYSIDDLQQVAAQNLIERAKEAADAERIVTDEVERFHQRLQSLDAVPTILALQQHAEQLRLAELDRNRAKLAGLTPEQQAAVEAMTRSMMNKFLHGPVTGLREAAHEGDTNAMTLLQRLFSKGR